MSFFSNLGKNLAEQAKRFAPAALSPEKRFARGMITVSALMTMADGSAEDSEVEKSSQISAGHRSIQQYLTPANSISSRRQCGSSTESAISAMRLLTSSRREVELV